MTTTQSIFDDRNLQVAQIIRSQIAVSTFMTLGASDLMRDGADFTFKARIIPTGKRAPRVMRVAVHLNGWDLYDVTVGYMKPRTFEWVQHAEARDLDAKQMNRYLFSLDREG